MKYIRFAGNRAAPVFVEFPDFVEHVAIAEALRPVLGAVVSAGFVTDSGECEGRSESLGVWADPSDTRIRQITMRRVL